jgi:hypothetical protein
MMIVHPATVWRGGRVVYRGGLENRFGLTPTGVRIPPSPPAFAGSENEGCRAVAKRRAGVIGKAPSCGSGKPEKGGENFEKIDLGRAVIGASLPTFGGRGRSGNWPICAGNREELKKCTWPTWEELKGSTVLIMISIALLGGFTVWWIASCLLYSFFKL